MQEQLRQLPSVQVLLDSMDADSSIPYPWLRAQARAVIDRAREQMRTGSQAPSRAELQRQLQQALDRLRRQRLQPVLNATGVLIHTNLGRAPLPKEAMAKAAEALAGYCSLEFDLESGRRGKRAARLEQLIAAACGTESSLVVNNNAAAVLLALASLAPGREVIVSRGELVEIGGGFRIPEVIAQSGCRLVEVGTTNRTRLSDYAGAVTENTGALLKIHPSNFRIHGFTEETSRGELRELADRAAIWFIEDLGSGAFWQPPVSGPPEPLVPAAARHAHLVTCSGDKLLGGPQAGILAGMEHAVTQAGRHPLFRALRSDKLSLFLLQEIFTLLINDRTETLPLWQMMHQPLEQLRQRAEQYCHHLGPGLSGEITATASTIGGGALPDETIATWAAAVSADAGSAEDLLRSLRHRTPPLIGRIMDDRVILDPRTIDPDDDALVWQLLKEGGIPC